MFAPASKKQEQFINSDSFVTVYGGAAGCLDADTEFLTPHGWKKISQYEVGDLVAQYNPEDDLVNFVEPKEYIKAPCTHFKRMQARGLDFVLSDDHLVPYWKKKDLNPHLKFWSDVLEDHKKGDRGFRHLIKTGFSYSGKGIDLTEGELRLQIAVQADGRIVKGGKNNYTQMRFSKKRKYDRLKSILEDWGLPYKDNGSKFCERYSNKTAYEIIVFPKFADKVFDFKYYQATKMQLEIIKDEVGHWDGTIYPSGLVRYSTTVKKNADFIQFVFHALGYNSSLSVRDESTREDCNDCYQVDCVSKGDGYRSFTGKGYRQEVEIVKSIDGFQYCFDLGGGFFLARRNNKVFITHNSGKSYMGLMRFLLYVDDPNFFGYVFRLNATDMKGGGGLFQTACRMFQAYDKRVKYTKQPMCIYFPSGATINFTGIDGDSGLESIRGIEISAAMIDEGSQHDEDTVFWIISRLRTKAKMIPNIWITCNPSPDSFLCGWLEKYYLYPKGTIINDESVEGRPNPEVDGDLRWFLRLGNEMVWGATKEELIEKYSSSFPTDRLSGLSTCQPRSFRFISATCHDNPPLLESDPNYVSNLLNLPRIEKERLYFGSWFAREETSGYFKRSWLDGRMIDNVDHSQVKRWVRCFDIAYSVPSESNPHPDYTASVLMAKMQNDDFVIVHAERVRMRAGEVEDHVIDVILKDKEYYKGNYQAYLPQDPSAGQMARVYWAKLGLSRGVALRFHRVTSQNGKIGSFQPFSASAENGLVKAVKDPEWNDFYFSELESFDGKRSTNTKKDD